MKITRALFPILGVAILVLVWALVSWAGIVNPVLLPGPNVVLFKAYELLTSGDLTPDLRFTLTQMLTSFGLAALGGTALGLAMGSFKPVYRATIPLLDFFRSVPVTSLYPVFVLTLGIGALSKLAMAFVAAVWVVALNTAYGVQHCSPVRTQMATLYGASRRQVFLLVRFFETLPQTAVGLRVALSYVLVVEILAEMFMGSALGLGQRLTDAYTKYRIAELYAVILIIGLIGFGANRLFQTVEQRIIHWK